MRRAKEQGRWVNKAPIGYSNYCSPDGLKSIILKEPEASIIRIAFEEVSSFRGTTIDAYLNAVNAGLKCSRSNFWRLLQNPVYAGNIPIAKIETPVRISPGLHVGIVTVEVFEKVQQLFRKEDKKRSVGFHPNFPLRGFIHCNKCGRRLTGSGSSGRSEKYYYYHCVSPCYNRIRTEVVSEVFLRKLKTFKLPEEYLLLYRNIVSEMYRKESNRIELGKGNAIKAIEQFADRVAKAKNLLLDAHIDFKAYGDIKRDFETKIAMLGNTISSYSKDQIEFSYRVNNAGKYLSKMDAFYTMLDEKSKRSFLNNVLTKGACWEGGSGDELFNLSFRKMYSSEQVAEIKNEDNSLAQITQLLKNLAAIKVDNRVEFEGV
ncbi:hypothetical protein GWC95_15820 [Sediminibacterium roseum]|uniref:Recombinase domain-containing protein n=1 Tax=Sediminibacterium roseum TaxID=1978412 RepID=A0ABW9ZYL2_9BACT|nr:recombinase family protein [Sediminibacterium roseum]NCI51397.1 hypothetical protein [Sediminibacterium roseum]